MSKMVVYHGSYTRVKEPYVKSGQYTKDFGNGFYCTIIKEQAERWAKRYNTPIINIYELQINNSLKIMEFKEMTEEWLDFIVDCRHGKQHIYDIVIGAMANDQIYNFISDYVDGIITREQFWIMAKFKYPTHQINFCTDEAIKCLKYRECQEVIR
ncbi:MAG: hypothetical protein K0S71_138 [Clostridia bacterium]|nr:hypothetical protein [Clostridia bacterium]